MQNKKIFGYEWKDIQRAQQGGRLNQIINVNGNKSASVQCFRCEKYFKLPTIEKDKDAFPVQCKHCGYAHTTSDAKSANWPI